MVKESHDEAPTRDNYQCVSVHVSQSCKLLFTHNKGALCLDANHAWSCSLVLPSTNHGCESTILRGLYVWSEIQVGSFS